MDSNAPTCDQIYNEFNTLKLTGNIPAADLALNKEYWKMHPEKCEECEPLNRDCSARRNLFGCQACNSRGTGCSKKIDAQIYIVSRRHGNDSDEAPNTSTTMQLPAFCSTQNELNAVLYKAVQDCEIGLNRQLMQQNPMDNTWRILYHTAKQSLAEVTKINKQHEEEIKELKRELLSATNAQQDEKRRSESEHRK
ncbi:hypothetical protein BDQ17DRAFT_1435912 [Cyathus striatus]|nr:hypothetical protein BDQ17DRAFT_1435912 [Cyathus striatus]